MKNNLKLALWLILSTTLLAQNISIKVSGLENSRASLYSLELEKSYLIESINSDSKGQFRISANTKLNTGFYRLVFNNKAWLNFVCDGKEIKIKTNKNELLETLEVLKSDANQKYYKFLNLTSIYKREEENFQKALAKYPNNGKELKLIKKKFIDIHDKYLAFINKLSQIENKSLISRYIRSAQEPKVEFDLDAKAKTKYLKEHFWDNVDFSDEGLIYTDLFVNKTVEYLGCFVDSNLKEDLVQKEYQSAVDIILNKAKVNELVYQQMTEYLIDGFKKLGLGNVIDYIVDYFVITDDLCLDSQTDNIIQMRINQSKVLKKGIKVSNIKLTNSTDELVELYNINTEKVLILFYSSHCPHCQELLPELFKLYSNRMIKEFEVYAISLDTDFTEWQNFVKNNKFTWINVSDLKGWESEVSYDFYIYATPTMFLVDKYFRIIDKPKNLEELKTVLY